MLAAHHPRIDATAAADRLYLLFSCADTRYGLDVSEVAEVLPSRRLQPVAQAPVWVAGIFSYRGCLVPVLDLSTLLAGQPAARRTSTRIVLVHYSRDENGPSHLLGLRVERAGETLRCAPSEFHDYGLDNPHAAYLGPVYQGPQGLVQWVRVQALLPAEAHALLFPDEPDTVAQEVLT